MYQKVYFYIDSQYRWGHGFPNRTANIQFHEEVRRLFRCADWEIRPGCNSAESDTAVKGKQSLYLHPMEFSGVILTEEIPSVQNAIRAARSFRLRNIGRFEIYQDMSDEDYMAYLDSRREEMIGDILARYKTGRRNLFYTGDMSESIGSKYRILRLGHDARYRDRAFQYVADLINELIRDGRLRTGETNAGLGIRTALQYELKANRSQEQRRISA